MPAELLVDIGHSRVKWAAMQDGALDPLSIGRAPIDAPDSLMDAAGALKSRRAILAGQSRPEAVRTIAERLRRHGVEIDTISTGDRDLPVAPAYHGLGCDRWLALQHAWTETRGAQIVIDCGSAITVDVVDGAGVHQGGWIMAGLAVARDGLIARAPGLEVPDSRGCPAEEPARATDEAIARGSRLLAAGGIERAVRAAERFLGQPGGLWITGGDAVELAEHLELDARHEPHLVLYGLAMAMQAT